MLPGPEHISVVSSSFMQNNKVKLKSENLRKKNPVNNNNGKNSNLVINLNQIRRTKKFQMSDRTHNIKNQKIKILDKRINFKNSKTFQLEEWDLSIKNNNFRIEIISKMIL